MVKRGTARVLPYTVHAKLDSKIRCRLRGSLRMPKVVARVLAHANRCLLPWRPASDRRQVACQHNPTSLCRPQVVVVARVLARVSRCVLAKRPASDSRLCTSHPRDGLLSRELPARATTASRCVPARTLQVDQRQVEQRQTTWESKQLHQAVMQES
jgi:hypothetical protein